MKTEQEQIEKMQEIIGDCWEFDSVSAELGNGDGYINIEEAAKALVQAGYGDVSEYKAEIERLKDKSEELRNEKWDVQDDLDCYCNEMPNKIKQAQIDMLNRVMTYINNKIEAEYGDMSDSVNYLTIDIDDFDDFIDELIKEVQND